VLYVGCFVVVCGVIKVVVFDFWEMFVDWDCELVMNML